MKRSRITMAIGNDRAGFTLVEIMVAVAIIAIMAGIMVPMVHKVWESNEKSETRQKMAELKRAMVGDQRLYQNGIRMHYGFVGDNGDLPTSIGDLVNDSGAFVNWNGPYLVGAFDPNDYGRDVWGRDLVFTRHDPPLALGGQNIAATLASLGPDGIADTADDLDENSDPELQILVGDVWPTATLQGNLDYVFTANTTTTPSLWSRIWVRYNLPAGNGEVFSECFSVATGEVEAGIAKSVRQAFTTVLVVDLPVGRVNIDSRLYDNMTCSTEPVLGTSNSVAIYVGNGVPVVAVNLPTLTYNVN